MDKRKLHHQYTKIRIIKPWYFLVAALILFGIGVNGLRQNNIEALRLKDKVVEADKNNGDIEKALRDLRQYTYNHMNTDLSSGTTSIKQPIQLKHRYERLVAENAAKVKERNIQVKNEAEANCAAQYPAGGFNSARVACVADYVSKHAVKEQPIPTELYKFDFVSPGWTADKAGLSLLGGALLLFLFMLRAAVGWWYRQEL